MISKCNYCGYDLDYKETFREHWSVCKVKTQEEITDTDRLEYMIKNGVYVFSYIEGWRVFHPSGLTITDPYNTPREALDVAIKSNK